MIQQITTKRPSECTSISEVRQEIDHIDQVIIKLISERFGYVKEVVKYKEPNAGSIEAPQRRIDMMVQRRQWAEEGGLNPDAIEHIYNELVEYFISEEKKIMNV